MMQATIFHDYAATADEIDQQCQRLDPELNHAILEFPRDESCLFRWSNLIVLQHVLYRGRLAPMIKSSTVVGRRTMIAPAA